MSSPRSERERSKVRGNSYCIFTVQDCLGFTFYQYLWKSSLGATISGPRPFWPQRVGEDGGAGIVPCHADDPSRCGLQGRAPFWLRPAPLRSMKLVGVRSPGLSRYVRLATSSAGAEHDGFRLAFAARFSTLQFTRPQIYANAHAIRTFRGEHHRLRVLVMPFDSHWSATDQHLFR